MTRERSARELRVGIDVLLRSIGCGNDGLYSGSDVVGEFAGDGFGDRLSTFGEDVG